MWTQGSSAPLLEPPVRQTCARQVTTARPGLVYLLQRTEEQQGTGVPQVITVLVAPQRRCRVLRDITATKAGTVASQTACPVLQVWPILDFYSAFNGGNKRAAHCLPAFLRTPVCHQRALFPFSTLSGWLLLPGRQQRQRAGVCTLLARELVPTRIWAAGALPTRDLPGSTRTGSSLQSLWSCK